MKVTPLARFGRSTFGALLALTSVFLQPPLDSPGQLVFSGLPIESKKFEILVSPFAYSDSMLDRRWGFKGREYLSGEWAAAVYYEGGHLPAMTRWLNPEFVFPDHVTPLPHFESKFDPPFRVNPANGDGFPVYESSFGSVDIEFLMSYEMRDLGTNETERLPIGLVPASGGGSGSNLWSGRYVFKQSYRITNVSGRTLNNFRFYQFIHALQSTSAVYDDRDYGGQLPSYHHTLTQWGDSHALHSRRGTTYSIRDFLAVSSHLKPSGMEVGVFASTNHQSHWPESGTVASVESNSLNGNDQIFTNDNSFVCGALCFDLGTLSPGGTTNIDFILSVRSFYTLLSNYPPVNVVIHKLQPHNGWLDLEFEETTGNPFVSYTLRKSIDVSLRLSDWQQLAIPYFINQPSQGRNSYMIPIDPTEPHAFYSLGVTINETPF
jgi:hypothetical protein